MKADLAEAVYRFILKIVALDAGFRALPHNRFAVGCAILFLAGGFRAVIAHADTIDQRQARMAWQSELTTRIALQRLHNMVIRQQDAEDTWDGRMPVWEQAHKEAVEDIQKFDDDKGGFSAINDPDGRHYFWLHLPILIAADGLAVALASFFAAGGFPA